MKTLNYNQLRKILRFTVATSLFLIGYSSTQAATTIATAAPAISANTVSVVTLPVITVKNNSATNANCSYYITLPDGEPHGQTPIIAASRIVVGNSATWNYTDTIADADNGKSFTSTTKTAICSYNQGFGDSGPGSAEGGYYIEHNTQNNTIIFTGYGLPSSKTTVNCLNAAGQRVTQLLDNNYSPFTCYLNGVSSAINVSMEGKLNTGANPLNQQVTEKDHTSFTSGNGTEDGCMIDNNTGLMWVKDLNTVSIIGLPAGSAPNTSYANAQASIEAMNKTGFCGHNDWRLPSINEISSLINYTAKNPQEWLKSKGFANLADARSDGDYWTTTNHVPNQEAPWAGYNWISMMSQTGKGRTAFSVGKYFVEVKQPQTLFVWPVRSTASTLNAFAPVAQTGDKISVGKTWPAPRFVVDVSGKCMIDKLTGLTWIKDQANLKTVGGSRVLANYVNAQATVAQMNKNGGYCGITDWRLPTVKELGSLVNYSKSDFAAWLNTQGFKAHNAGEYWNSFWTGDIVAEAVTPGYPGRVWYMNSDGEFDFGYQVNMFNVLPVSSSKVKEGILPTPTSTPSPLQAVQKYPSGIGSYSTGTTVLGRDGKEYKCLIEAACNYSYSTSYYDPVTGQWATAAWQLISADTKSSVYPIYPQGYGSYVVGTIVIGDNNNQYQCKDINLCNSVSYAPSDVYPATMAWTKVVVVPTPAPTPSPTPTIAPTPTVQYPEYPTGAGSYVQGSMVSTSNGNQYRCLVASNCNYTSGNYYNPLTGNNASLAWELVNYAPYDANKVYPNYPTGQSTYAEGSVVVGNDGKQYRCINTNICRVISNEYTPGSGSYADSAWSPVNNAAPQAYPAGAGNYNKGDVVIGSDGKQYRCKDKSSCNYTLGNFYNPVGGTYATSAWTKIN